MARYVALLRGINVGGKNAIRMPALKMCFEGLGFENVTTYIASGNVIFQSSQRATALEARIEQALAATFGATIAVLVRGKAQLASVVAHAPHGFGTSPARYRYDVMFLKASVRPAAALAAVPLREGVDRAEAGPGVVYSWRLISRAAQSRIGRITTLPIYGALTIRNWNTTTKLLDLLG